jgi:hypothetical protein
MLAYGQPYQTTRQECEAEAPPPSQDLLAGRQVGIIAFVDDLPGLGIVVNVGIMLHFDKIFAEIIRLGPVRGRPFLTIPPADQVAFNQPVLICEPLGPPLRARALLRAALQFRLLLFRFRLLLHHLQDHSAATRELISETTRAHDTSWIGP